MSIFGQIVWHGQAHEPLQQRLDDFLLTIFPVRWRNQNLTKRCPISKPFFNCFQLPKTWIQAKLMKYSEKCQLSHVTAHVICIYCDMNELETLWWCIGQHLRVCVCVCVLTFICIAVSVDYRLMLLHRTVVFRTKK